MEPKAVEFLIKTLALPWLVWPNELDTVPCTEGFPVQFPVRAHTWVVGLIPDDHPGGSQCFPLISAFLSPFLSL